MKILQVIYEFTSKVTEAKCGLYHIEMDSGNKYYLLRNNESVGAIEHLYGHPVNECIGIIRDDVKQEFFNLLKK